MPGEDTNTGMPQIGDENFSGPPNNTLRSKPTPETEAKIEQTMSEMEEESAADKVEKSKTPEELAEDYEKGLAEVGLTLEQARGVIENLVVEGYHEESTRIGPLTFRYRTRGHHDTLRTYTAVESSGISMPQPMQEFINRHNTAGSLVSWGDRKFEHPTSLEERDKAFQERLEFLSGTLSDLVAVKMMQIVHDFDKKMAAVMAEGSPEDF